MVLGLAAISLPAYNQAILLNDNHSLTGIPFNGKLVLGSERDSTLWISDGTASGTVQLSTVKTDDNGFGMFKNKLYFAGLNSTNGSELWESDGTPGGTRLTSDIWPGADNSKPDDFVVFNNKLYFTAFTPANGRELYEYTGSGAPSRITDINPGAGNSFNNPSYFQHNNILYFTASNATTTAIYTMQGSTIAKLMDIPAGTSLGKFEQLGNNVFFPLFGMSNGCKIYKSNGTVSGTSVLKEFTSMLAGFADPLLINIDNKIYFTGTTDAEGMEPWITDGNTVDMIADINPGPDGSLSMFANAVVLKGKVTFMAMTGDNGAELWATDGTAAGTSMLKDINTNPTEGSFPVLMPAFNLEVNEIGENWTDAFSRHLTYNGFIFFSADDGVHGQALWKTDGTEANTVMVKDIHPDDDEEGVSGSYIYTKSGFIFSGNAGSGTQPWISDGTEAGTRGLVTLNPSGDSDPEFLFIWNGDIYLNANNGNGGPQGYYDLFRLQGPYMPLPVTLKALTATTRTSDVLVSWTTSSESNSDRFMVMRSTNGEHFENAGELPAAGNSSTERYYSFIDEKVYNQGVNKLYYRLDMIDRDGKSSLSKIVSATLNPLSVSLRIFPNPVSDILKVSYNLNADGIISIADLYGKIVHKSKIPASPNGLYELNVSAYPAGTYLLKLTGDKGVESTQKFIRK